jgi:hypothetical protein
MSEHTERTEQTERDGVAAEVADRLRRRGVALDGREDGEALVTLLEAVEAFEREVGRQGGDLMVDEPVDERVAQPDDAAFVLPRRGAHETIAAFTGRIREAAASLASRARRR